MAYNRPLPPSITPTGGVMVVTAVNLVYFTAALSFAGVGGFLVLGGMYMGHVIC